MINSSAQTDPNKPPNKSSNRQSSSLFTMQHEQTTPKHSDMNDQLATSIQAPSEPLETIETLETKLPRMTVVTGIKRPVSLVKVSHQSSRDQAQVALSSSSVSSSQTDEKSSEPSISIVVVRHGNAQSIASVGSTRETQTAEAEVHQDEQTNEDTRLSGQINNNDDLFRVPLDKDTILNRVGSGIIDQHETIEIVPKQKLDDRLPVSFVDETSLSNCSTDGEHFEIIWSNLSYKIEPKWHKRINILDRIFPFGQSIDNVSSATSTVSSSAGMNDNQQQMHVSSHSTSQLSSTSTSKPKSHVDPIEIFSDLNGCIKSGQMTAILGPSGE